MTKEQLFNIPCQCGERKKTYSPFCDACVALLPPEMKQELFSCIHPLSEEGVRMRGRIEQWLKGHEAGKAYLSALLADRMQEMSEFCERMEDTAVQETRWHDAATLKTQRAVWQRAFRLIKYSD